MSYRPELENIRTKKLLRDVYEPNAAFKSPEALSRQVQHFLTDTGAYRNTKTLITERFSKPARQTNSEL
jgi:hypothetical protein